MFKRKPYSGSYDDFKDVFIDAKTMEIHQEKHHQGYQDKLNKALEGIDHNYATIEEVLMNILEIPEDKRTAVFNNGGGLVNHNTLFDIISPKGGGNPVGEVMEMVQDTFESFDNLKKEFNTAAKTLFGSGWAWLSIDENNQNLHITALPNQESPWVSNHKPLVGLDVWEHAYYLHYQNRRADYVDAFWNVIDWEKVEEIYQSYK